MKVILLENIQKLVSIGEIISVKRGYARNFLLPTQKALRATDENIQIFEGKKAELEAKILQTKAEAETINA